jgi:hypothetical protein
VSFPFDLHSAAVFDSHIPCQSPAMPRICLSESDFSRPWQGDGMRQRVGDLPAFGLFLLPCPVPGGLLSEAYQSQMQVASVKQSDICHGQEEAYYFWCKDMSTCIIYSTKIMITI